MSSNQSRSETPAAPTNAKTKDDRESSASKKPPQNTTTGAVKSKDLKAEDLNYAEVTWIRGVQAHSFAMERQNLLHG